MMTNYLLLSLDGQIIQKIGSYANTMSVLGITHAATDNAITH